MLSVWFFIPTLIAIAILFMVWRIKREGERLMSGIYNVKTGVPLKANFQPALRGLAILLSAMFTGKRGSNRDLGLASFQCGMNSSFMIGLFGNEIEITHPDDIKKVLMSPDFDKDFDALGFGWFKTVMGESLICAKGPKGVLMRKQMNPAFSLAKVKSLLPVFVKSTQKFVQILEKSDLSKPIDVNDGFKNMTFDIIGVAGFGYDFHAMDGETPEKQHIDTITEGLSSPLELLTHGWYSKTSFPFPKKLRSAFASSKKLILDVINKRIEERKENIKKEGSDILDIILDEQQQPTGNDSQKEKVNEKPKQSSFIKQIFSNVLLFFVAGHETSAGTLTNLFYYISKYPQHQEEAYQEIQRICGSGPISPEEVGNFQFIQALIKETLRISPAVFHVGSRIAIRDTQVGDYFIPKGTYLSAHIARANFSSEFWSNPMEFTPHRFMPPSPEENNPILSFGFGSRVCLGQKFAIMEMTIAIAMILQKFRVRLVDGYVWEDKSFTLTTVPKDGLPLIFERR